MYFITTSTLPETGQIRYVSNIHALQYISKPGELSWKVVSTVGPKPCQASAAHCSGFFEASTVVIFFLKLMLEWEVEMMMMMMMMTVIIHLY
jgi:hypothetical protein